MASSPETTAYRRSIPRAEAAIFRAFAAHTGAGGMGGAALTARYAPATQALLDAVASNGGQTRYSINENGVADEDHGGAGG